MENDKIQKQNQIDKVIIDNLKLEGGTNEPLIEVGVNERRATNVANNDGTTTPSKLLQFKTTEQLSSNEDIHMIRETPHKTTENRKKETEKNKSNRSIGGNES